MNQRQAFKATLELAWERGMHFQAEQAPSENLTYRHLVNMYDQIAAGDFSPTKMGRWLGWAQASVVAAGIATLDEMKAINKRFMNDEATLLDGAQIIEPEHGVQMRRAEEFAARWNSWTPEHRQKAFENMQEAMSARNRCFQQDHDGLQDQLRKAQERIVELLVRPPLQYAIITDADLGRAAQTFYEEVGKADGVQLTIAMTDKAILVDILEKTLAALGFKRPLVPAKVVESWTTEQTHDDCEHCEAAVELAIQGCQDGKKDHETWTVVTAPPDSHSPAEEHVGKASRN